MKMEAEMLIQAKQRQQASGSQGRGMKQILSHNPQKEPTLQAP